MQQDMLILEKKTMIRCTVYNHLNVIANCFLVNAKVVVNDYVGHVNPKKH